METVSISGNGTVTVDNRVLTDLADGDFAVIRYPNDLTATRTGKNGNTLIASNSTGQQAELEVRVLRGSSDDVYLNGRLTNQKSDQPGFVLINAEVIQNIGTGDGTVKKDSHRLKNGVFRRNVELMLSAEGNTESAISIYTLDFGTSTRVIA